MAELVRREVTLEVDVEKAWQAIVDADRLSQWLADEVELEPWPGGEARFATAGRERSGWVEQATPPQRSTRAHPGRLVFWWSEDGEPATRVELEVAAVPEGARVRVTETRPLDVLDLVGTPLPGTGGPTYGPALVAA